MAGLQLCFGEFSAPSSESDNAVRLNPLPPASFLSLPSDHPATVIHVGPVSVVVRGFHCMAFRMLTLQLQRRLGDPGAVPSGGNTVRTV